MRKINVAYWVALGVSIGASLGVVFNNIPAGLSMGAGTGGLLTLLAGLKK